MLSFKLAFPLSSFTLIKRLFMGFSGISAVKNLPGRHRFDPCVRKIPWRRKWQPTPVLLPGKFHRWRAWRAMVHGVAKSRTQLSDFTFTFSLDKYYFIDTNKVCTHWILKSHNYTYPGNGDGTVLSRHLASIRPDVMIQDCSRNSNSK